MNMLTEDEPPNDPKVNLVASPKIPKLQRELNIVLFIFPEVEPQTAFQHDDAPTEADRSTAEPFEVGTDR